jgi:hypothetical protein
MMRSASSRTTSILCSTSRMVLLRSAFSLRIRSRITGHFVGVHARGRLVEHVDLRLQRHQHGHFQLALVAVRQVGQRSCALSFIATHLDRVGLRLRRLSLWSLTLHRFRPACGAPAPPAARSPAPSGAGTGWSAGRPGPGRRVRCRHRQRAVRSRPPSDLCRRWPCSWPEIRLKYVVLPAPLGPDDGRQRARLERAGDDIDRRRGRRSGSSGRGFRAQDSWRGWSWGATSVRAAFVEGLRLQPGSFDGLRTNGGGGQAAWQAARQPSQRLLRSARPFSGLISRTSSGTPQARPGPP